MRKNKNALGLIAGGLMSGIIACITVSSLLKYLGEYSSVPLIFPIITGLSISLFSIFALKLKNSFITKIQWYNKKTFWRCVVLTLFILIILYGLYIFSENFYMSWLIIIIIYSIGIWITSILFFSIKKEKKKFVIGGCFGGILAGITISLIYLLIINFSIDEGYFILLTFLLALIGGIIGLFNATIFNIDYNLDENRFLFSEKTPILISILLIFSILIPIITYNYWDRMDLNNGKSIPEDDKSNFICSDLSSRYDSMKTYHSEKDIIYFLENKTDKKLDVFAELYLLSGNEKWAKEFKNRLIEDAQNDQFLGISGSVKAWQYEVMIRGYYYELISKANPVLFNDAENDLILNWFIKINEVAYEATWVDYIYGFLFKRFPDGLYSNQEIGNGMLSILSEVLESKYPELSKKNKEYISKFGVGWKGNFRNPDDGIVYHHHLWIKNAYMISKFGGQENYLYSNNSRNSFEWIMLQWPPNGMSPAYNVPANYTPFDIIVLGSYLFHDGRYFFLANIMLENEMENPNRFLDYFIGLEYWDDKLIPVMPEVGSCYITGTTGIAPKPGPIKPDKIVLREGWNEDSLYALLNLRFSGWHSYKATNSFISVMYGEPFVVEKLEVKNHSWIPKGKADQRDKKIDRNELNGFQIEKTGLQKVIYQITGLGNDWAQDPPRFAEVLAFNSTPLADYSITRISNWHGWVNTRTSVLVKGKDSYIVVFDQNKGESPGKVAVNWHLKGDAEINDQSIRLSNKNYSMNVHFPHFENDYRVEIHPTEYLDHPAVEIHKSDYDFYMISENKSETGFISLFYPERNNGSYKIETIDIRNYENKSMYPDAFGINIIKQKDSYIIGTADSNDIIHYGEIDTDADLFIMHKIYNLFEISFKKATIFKIMSDKTPFNMEQNGIELIKNREWQYINRTIIIYPVTNEGYINITT